MIETPWECELIARIWNARSYEQGADHYVVHFRHHVLARLKLIAAYFGGVLLRADERAQSDLTVIPFWEDWKPLGDSPEPDINHTVVASEAVAVLTKLIKV
jgi:hypothetical protein